MQALNENKVNSKHDMVSPLSEMGVDFVRDNREHPFPVDHEALLSLIQDEL